jgi:membrane protease subunit HflK
MTDKTRENENQQALKPADRVYENELDPGLRYLSRALKSSFFLLKVIMLVLVGLFLLSGFEKIRPDERGLVLRFGRIVGVGDERILEPGLRWVCPYPIEQLVRIPVEKKINLKIDSFWYYQRPEDDLPETPEIRRYVPKTLDPLRDGYCLVRNSTDSYVAGRKGSDYNIVHCKWQLTYQIDEPALFFTNINVEDVKPGQSYFNVITTSITPILKSLVEDAIVTVMVNYTIDEALRSQDRIPNHVETLLQERLNRIESGIKVVSIQLTDVTWPRQVNDAFLALLGAGQEKPRLIKEAQTYAEKTLNEAAGPVAEQLYQALNDENTSPQQMELLWDQIAGEGRETVDKALAYRTTVVENAKANAQYLQRILPEYRKRPKLVLQKIYQDAIQYVFDNVDEKMILQPTKGPLPRELRIMVNRDPMIKKEQPKEEETGG